MKFTDVKTLNHLLKEYGNTPGKNMPTANKDLGFQGDNSLSKSKKITKSPSTKTPFTGHPNVIFAFA